VTEHHVGQTILDGINQRDMPAVRRTHSSVVSDVSGSADAAMDKAWQPPLLRIGGHLVDGAGGQLRDSASRPNKRV
jgi:hypothetical protein